MRISLLLFCFALMPLAASAQPAPLGEAEAVRLALAREEIADLARAAREEAEAEVAEVDSWPNPVLQYSRERMKGAEAATEHAWQLSQELDLAGRRGLRESAARRRVDSAAQDVARREDDLAAEVRRAFHEALLKQSRVAAAERWIARFRGVEASVARLRRAGEASGYDHRRLAHELAAAEARLAIEQAELDRARQRVAGFLPGPGEPSAFTGELLPPPPPALDPLLARLPERSDLRALGRKAEAADLDGRAASRGWMPELTVAVGTKTVEGAFGRDTGATVSLSVPLPIFQRDEEGARRALAAGLAARAEYRLRLARAQGELRGLHRELTALIAAAQAYRARAGGASAELTRVAEAAYQGGESTLLELLDAYRAALDSETTALDLEWKARDARITFDLAAGSTR